MTLRHALLELGQGLRHHEHAARVRAAQLAAHGKHSMIIWTVMANRANRIAFAMAKDQQPYDARRWRSHLTDFTTAVERDTLTRTRGRIDPDGDMADRLRLRRLSIFGPGSRHFTEPRTSPASRPDQGQAA